MDFSGLTCLGVLNEGLTVLLAGNPACCDLFVLYKCFMASKSKCIPVAVSVPSEAVKV